MSADLNYSNRLQLLSECMTASMDEPDPDASINIFISALGDRAGADRISVYKTEGDYIHCVYEWSAADGVHSMQDVRVPIGSKYPRSWWKFFYARDFFILNDIEEYRETDPASYEIVRAEGIKRLILCPITMEHKSYGFVSIVNPDSQFMSEARRFFTLDVQFLSALLRHKENVDYIYRTERTDALTGLYNMAAFSRAINPLIQRVREGQETAVWDIVFFDIADFKVYNHDHGMYGGNLLLKTVAKILKEELGTDWAARFEADHFYVVIEDAGVRNFVERVHARIAELDTTPSVRVGIYTIDGSEKDAIHAADRAMIAGHETRGDYVHYIKKYDNAMENSITRATYLIHHVDEAVEKEWIRVYFQPIVGVLSREDASFEALSRWIDPVYGFMNPGEFISVLEDAHLLYKVDLFVVRKVCEEIKRREAAGEPPAHYSVNISRNDLDIPDIHKSINDILDSYGVSRDMIAMEITESAVVDSQQLIQDHIDEFHRDGYEVWLDDFGSGYSSLNTLHTFDFDLMKIDMIFLRNQNERTKDILTDIVDMAKRLGITVLTEGVETKEQFEFLESIGCTYIQGFYISKPLPADEVIAVLDQKKIGIESPEDSEFYRQIAKVNIISLNNAGQNSRDLRIDRRKRSIAIITTKNGVLDRIFMNQVGRQWAEANGVTTNEDIVDFMAVNMSDVYRNYRTGVLELHTVGETRSYYIDDISFNGKMRLALVAMQGSRRAYILMLTESDTAVSA